MQIDVPIEFVPVVELPPDGRLAGNSKQIPWTLIIGDLKAGQWYRLDGAIDVVWSGRSTLQRMGWEATMRGPNVFVRKPTP